jgi:hypothetical protein
MEGAGEEQERGREQERERKKDRGKVDDTREPARQRKRRQFIFRVSPRPLSWPPFLSALGTFSPDPVDPRLPLAEGANAHWPLRLHRVDADPPLFHSRQTVHLFWRYLHLTGVLFSARTDTKIHGHLGDPPLGIPSAR